MKQTQLGNADAEDFSSFIIHHSSFFIQ